MMLTMGKKHESVKAVIQVFMIGRLYDSEKSQKTSATIVILLNARNVRLQVFYAKFFRMIEGKQVTIPSEKFT